MIAAGNERAYGSACGIFCLGARTQEGGEGATERGESEVEDEDESRHQKQKTEAVFRDVEPGEHWSLSGAALLLDGRAKLREHRGELCVDLGGVMEDEAREDKAAGVDRGHREEDGETAEQTKAGAETGAEGRWTDLRVVDAEDDNRGSDGPEPGEQNERRKRKREQRESSGKCSCERGVADGGSPDDGVRMRGAQDAVAETGVKNGALFLSRDEELFGDGDLRSAAVGAKDKRALVLLKEGGVTARAMRWGHSLRLREDSARSNAPSYSRSESS